MTNRSFIRFGGIAGILLAATSWLAVVEYLALVPPSQRAPVGDVNAYLGSLTQNPTGILILDWLYALIAFWALIGITAVYFRLRDLDEAWAFFATLVGAIGSIGTIISGLYTVAQLKYATALFPFSEELALNAYNMPSTINPFGIMTFGLTGIWFLTVSLLMLRQDFPRLLAYLGLIAFADLAMGFFASFAGMSDLSATAALIAGVVGGPVFWLWLGILMFRESTAQVQQATSTPPASNAANSLGDRVT